MDIDTRFYLRCINTLEHAYNLLMQSDPTDLDYDMYRSACVKEFELILEQSGKLLNKALKPYFHSSKSVDRLPFKELFRQAALHGFMDVEACERWLHYRDNRNNTAHDYGQQFAEKTLTLLVEFCADAKHLEEQIRAVSSD